MKPMLKAPGSKRLLECDRLLSNFAFKLNLRRYNLAAAGVLAGQYRQRQRAGIAEPVSGVVEVYLIPQSPLAGAYTRPLFGSM
jgi:hypothetical protein